MCLSIKVLQFAEEKKPVFRGHWNFVRSELWNNSFCCIPGKNVLNQKLNIPKAVVSVWWLYKKLSLSFIFDISSDSLLAFFFLVIIIIMMIIIPIIIINIIIITDQNG